MNAQPAVLHAAGTVVRTLPTAATTLFLTFDDGPDPEWTPRVLDVLAQCEVRATFFVLGRLASRHQTLLRRALGLGHALGNHSYAHRHPWLLSARSARAEVRDGADAVAQATGAWPRWYRPPHGRLGRYGRDAARECGESIALWSRSAVDWGPLASGASVARRLDGIGPGEIVLLHDGPLRHNHPACTLAALPVVLEALGRRGLQSAPLPHAATMAS